MSLPGAKKSRDVRDRLEGHHREAFAWALTCCMGDHGLAEDVLQTSYLKVLDGRARFDGRSAFRTWLFSVIRHTAADSWRSAWRRLRRSLTAEDERTLRFEETALRSGDSDLDLLAAAEALKQLPKRQAQVLSLMYGHGMTVRESADVLGISQGSAATHLHRGKKRLRELLTDSGQSNSRGSNR